VKNRGLIFLFVLILPFLIYSCKDNKKRDEATKIVSEWMGKEIRFPENVSCYVSGKDTLSELCNEYFQKEFKILLYVDSTGCSSCRLKLFEWKQLMEEADSLFQGRVGFLLFFQPKNVKEMEYLFIRDRFDYPVFMDLNGTINRLNRFPQAMEYQCFLLDKDNKVLMIGNPVLNRRIWELYKQQIGGEKRATTPITTIQVNSVRQELSGMKMGETYSCVFEIENTGSNPFVILGIHSSCGCAVPTWDKQPITSGGKTEIRVEVKPESTGFFNKTIDVYGNIEQSVLKLSIIGTVE